MRTRQKPLPAERGAWLRSKCGENSIGVNQRNLRTLHSQFPIASICFSIAHQPRQPDAANTADAARDTASVKTYSGNASGLRKRRPLF